MLPFTDTHLRDQPLHHITSQYVSHDCIICGHVPGRTLVNERNVRGIEGAVWRAVDKLPVAHANGSLACAHALSHVISASNVACAQTDKSGLGRVQLPSH